MRCTSHKGRPDLPAEVFPVRSSIGEVATTIHTRGTVGEEGPVTRPRPGGAPSAPSPGARHALVIVNANASGTRRARLLLDAVDRTAREAGVRAPVRVTRSTRELEGALLDAGDRRVVLVGGDGSLQTAVNLAGTRPELALLPAGRANNIAHGIGIPLEPVAAAQVALHAPGRPVDLLRVETATGVLRCIEGLSAGFQAAARANYGAANSGDVGAGVRALLRGMREFRPWEAQVEVDNRVVLSGPVAQIFVSNLPRFGFGFRVNPVADPADGQLEAITAAAGSRRELARLLARAYRGEHLGRPGVALHAGRRVVVRGDLPLAGDSVPLGTGQAVVSVEAGAMRLAAPPW